MDSSVNGWLFGVVALTAVASVLVSAVCAWVLARAMRRVTDMNRDLLKANLALSEKPAAVQLARAMEATDLAAETVDGIPVRRMNRIPAGAS